MTKILVISRNLQNTLPQAGCFQSQDNSRIMSQESLSSQRKRTHRILPERAFNLDTSTQQLAIMTDHVRSVGIVSWTRSLSGPYCLIQVTRIEQGRASAGRRDTNHCAASRILVDVCEEVNAHERRRNESCPVELALRKQRRDCFDGHRNVVMEAKT